MEFVKMHGLGNDFVILDHRSGGGRLSASAVQAIADRRRGVGCDQLIVLGAAVDADAAMTIYNPDGSESGACGNATRCVAQILMRESGQERVSLRTAAGLLNAWHGGAGEITVDMGEPRLRWQHIPLAWESDILHLPSVHGPLMDGVAVNMGNPHAVFFVDDVEAVELEEYGPLMEHDPLFPERVNVEIVQIISDSELKMRVWERGAGETQACGSGACAVGVAASLRGLAGGEVQVHLPGGTLRIHWRDDEHVWMTGPVATSFAGVMDDSLLQGRG